jgi:restriction system protein
MDPYKFEQFVADVWEKRGYNTEVRNGSGDRGIDVVAINSETKKLIQVKRYNPSNKVGSQEIREYATLYQQVDDADTVLIVTSGTFTDAGRRLAADLEVEAVNGSELFAIVDNQAPDVAVKYLHQRTAGQNMNIDSSNSDGNVRPQEPEAMINNSPFDNPENYSKISPNQGYFDVCPECSNDGIWFGQLQDTRKVLKCGNCLSKWKEEQKKKGLLFKRFKTVGWKQTSGSQSGILKDIDEWNSS